MLFRKADTEGPDSELNELYYRVARDRRRARRQREGARVLQGRLRHRLDVPADAARPRRPAVQDGGLGQRREDLPDDPGPAPRRPERGGRRRHLLPARQGQAEARRAQEGAQHVREGARDRSDAPATLARRHRPAAAAGRLGGGRPRQAGPRRRRRRGGEGRSSSTRSATSTTRSCRTRRRRSPRTSRRSRSRPTTTQLLQKVLDLYTETKQWKKVVEIDRALHRELETDAVRAAPSTTTPPPRSSRDELKSLDEAVDYYNKALDSFFQPEKLPSCRAPEVVRGDRQGAARPSTTGRPRSARTAT